MKINWIQFFHDEKSHLSMPRLLSFMSFFPATYIALKTLSESIFAWYLSGYAASYVLAKGVDAWKDKARIGKK